MSSSKLALRYSNRDDLRRDFEQDLRLGRAFVKDAVDVVPLTGVTLVLEGPDGVRLELEAFVVMVSDQAPTRGAGLELRPFGDPVRQRIEAFAMGETATSIAPDGSEGGNAEATEASEEDSADDGKPAGPVSKNAHERVRGLSIAEQMRIARTGELSERVVLERMYGKQVWEALLANPRLTVPEVARIARKGTVPRVMLDQIVANTSWAQAGPVRRALLSNPRLGEEAIMRLLRAMPLHELRLMGQQTAYPAAVRAAARKLAKPV